MHACEESLDERDRVDFEEREDRVVRDEAEAASASAGIPICSSKIAIFFLWFIEAEDSGVGGLPAVSFESSVCWRGTCHATPLGSALFDDADVVSVAPWVWSWVGLLERSWVCS